MDSKYIWLLNWEVELSSWACHRFAPLDSPYGRPKEQRLTIYTWGRNTSIFQLQWPPGCQEQRLWEEYQHLPPCLFWNHSGWDVSRLGPRLESDSCIRWAKPSGYMEAGLVEDRVSKPPNGLSSQFFTLSWWVKPLTSVSLSFLISESEWSSPTRLECSSFRKLYHSRAICSQHFVEVRVQELLGYGGAALCFTTSVRRVVSVLIAEDSCIFWGSRAKEVTFSPDPFLLVFWLVRVGATWSTRREMFLWQFPKRMKTFCFLLLNIDLDLQPTEQPLLPSLPLSVNFLCKGQLCHWLLIPSESWFYMRSSLGPPSRRRPVGVLPFWLLVPGVMQLLAGLTF